MPNGPASWQKLCFEPISHRMMRWTFGIDHEGELVAFCEKEYQNARSISHESSRLFPSRPLALSLAITGRQGGVSAWLSRVVTSWIARWARGGEGMEGLELGAGPERELRQAPPASEASARHAGRRWNGSRSPRSVHGSFLCEQPWHSFRHWQVLGTSQTTLQLGTA